MDFSNQLSTYSSQCSTSADTVSNSTENTHPDLEEASIVESITFDALPKDVLILIAEQLFPHDRIALRGASRKTRTAVDAVGILPTNVTYVKIQDKTLVCHAKCGPPPQFQIVCLVRNRTDYEDSREIHFLHDHEHRRFSRYPRKIVELGDAWEDTVRRFLRKMKHILTLTVTTHLDKWPQFEYHNLARTFLVSVGYFGSLETLTNFFRVCPKAEKLLIKTVSSWSEKVLPMPLSSFPWTNTEIASRKLVAFEGCSFLPGFSLADSQNEYLDIHNCTSQFAWTVIEAFFSGSFTNLKICRLQMKDRQETIEYLRSRYSHLRIFPLERSHRLEEVFVKKATPGSGHIQIFSTGSIHLIADPSGQPESIDCYTDVGVSISNRMSDVFHVVTDETYETQCWQPSMYHKYLDDDNNLDYFAELREKGESQYSDSEYESDDRDGEESDYSSPEENIWGFWDCPDHD